MLKTRSQPGAAQADHVSIREHSDEEERRQAEELSVAKCIKRRTGQGLDDWAKKELAWHGLASRLAQVLMQQRVNNCGNTQRDAQWGHVRGREQGAGYKTQAKRNQLKKCC